jgi:hypothetical protein
MADRWARNKIVAYVSLSRLRRAGVWWATSDGRWTVDRTEEDGWDVAFAVEVSLNAGYSRRLSEKFRDAKNTRAKLGLYNGDLMYGYLRAPEPSRPVHAPASYKPPRFLPERDPQDFERLVQLGRWAAAGLTDRQIAEQANSLDWRLPASAKAVGPARHYLGDDDEGQPRYSTDAARIAGPRPFTKDTIRAMLIRPFPRAFSPRSDRGTVLAPDGTRIEGGHPAAWDWDLWHRMDEQRALRGVGGSRGQVEATGASTGRASRPYRVWPFSGIVVCAGCGSRLRAAAARNGAYPYYDGTARARNVPCPAGGHRVVRADLLDDTFAALLRRPLPDTWRADIAGCACGAGGRDGLGRHRRAPSASHLGA